MNDLLGQTQVIEEADASLDNLLIILSIIITIQTISILLTASIVSIVHFSMIRFTGIAGTMIHGLIIPGIHHTLTGDGDIITITLHSAIAGTALTIR